MTTPAKGHPAMSTPAAATTTPAPLDERVAMLDLDLPAEPAPVLPAWAAAAVALIRAIIVGVTMASVDAAADALGAVIAPLRLQPEGFGRAACREAVALKRAEIEGAYHRARTAAVAPAHTMEQSIPVLALVPPVATVAVTRPVLNARWWRLPATELNPWGARVDEGSPAIGDEVRIYRARGNQPPQRKYLTARHVVGAGGGIVVWAVSDVAPIATPVEAAPLVEEDGPEDLAVGSAPVEGMPGTLTDGTPVVWEIVDSMQPGAMAATYQEDVVPEYDAPTTLSADLAADVTTASMRDAAPTPRMGSVRAAGEVIPQPTNTVIGVGITHTPTGPSFADMSRAERNRLSRVGNETRATVRKLLTESTLIAGVVGNGSFLQAAWVGGGKTTLATVREVLATIDREHDAPKAPSAERYAGRAVESLRSRDFDTARLPTRDLPEGIKARWLVGRKLTGASITAGEAYGTALLIVSLRDDLSLTFEGDAGLSAAVESHYKTATGAETLHSDVLTAWLGGLLHKHHYAVKRGPHWYVPPGEVDAARRLLEVIEPLWGDHDRIPVTTGADLMRNLTRGLSDEVNALTKEYNLATETARERAKSQAFEASLARCKRMRVTDEAATVAATADAELAERRACISATIGARLLCELASVAAKVDGFRTVLGDESVAGIQTLITTLATALEPTCTPADMRTGMLELKPLTAPKGN